MSHDILAVLATSIQKFNMQTPFPTLFISPTIQMHLLHSRVQTSFSIQINMRSLSTYHSSIVNDASQWNIHIEICMNTSICLLRLCMFAYPDSFSFITQTHI